MKGPVLERLGRGDAVERFNWVTRAKIQSLMNEHYHRCKAAVDQHLEAYYGDRHASIFMRAGVTATVSVELFESQAVKLVGMLAENLKPFARDAKAFQLITEMTNGFLSYIDLVVGRIGPRIDLEMRNLPKSENSLPGAAKLWAESRTRILESLDRHRTQFGLPAKIAPAAEAPTIQEMEYLPPACEIEAEAEAEANLPHMGEANQPLPLAHHWHEMWTEIAVQLCTGKLRPMSQSDLGGAMSKWFADRGIEGTEVEVDECARQFWLKLVATQRVTSSLDQSAIDRAMEEGGSTFNRLAWQSGSLRSAGLITGGNTLSSTAEFRCSAAVMSPERTPGHLTKSEPAEEEPASASMRYHVSWSM